MLGSDWGPEPSAKGEEEHNALGETGTVWSITALAALLVGWGLLLIQVTWDWYACRNYMEMQIWGWNLGSTEISEARISLLCFTSTASCLQPSSSKSYVADLNATTWNSGLSKNVLLVLASPEKHKMFSLSFWVAQIETLPFSCRELWKVENTNAGPLHCDREKYNLTFLVVTFYRVILYFKCPIIMGSFSIHCDSTEYNELIWYSWRCHKCFHRCSIVVLPLI